MAVDVLAATGAARTGTSTQRGTIRARTTAMKHRDQREREGDHERRDHGKRGRFDDAVDGGDQRRGAPGAGELGPREVERGERRVPHAAEHRQDGRGAADAAAAIRERAGDAEHARHDERRAHQQQQGQAHHAAWCCSAAA